MSTNRNAERENKARRRSAKNGDGPNGTARRLCCAAMEDADESPAQKGRGSLPSACGARRRWRSRARGAYEARPGRDVVHLNLQVKPRDRDASIRVGFRDIRCR